MHTLLKKVFKKQNIIKSFRKVIAYLLIFSLFWQNYLWAVYLIEEDLEGARTRIYAQGKVGIVEPGAIRDDAVHNVFEDLHLLEGGIVFKGNSQAKTIYNRIYNESPIPLSGIIEADRVIPMVFANPGGVTLENPDFKRVNDLTLVAGGLAQTNEGMAYGVDKGILKVRWTFFEDTTDVKFLTFAGREIHVAQSLLSPSETITLTAGQHIKGLEQKKWMNVLTQGSSHPHQTAIHLDESTIIHSKGISLTSLEEGAAIHAKGLLQATDEDIIIKARGDIYLDKLLAHRNLTIETTGKVFFGNQAFVKGVANITAANINIDKELSSVGHLYLNASQHLTINGILDSQDKINLIGQNGVDLKGNITSGGAFTAISKGTISQEGSLFSEDSVRIKGQVFIKNGNLVSRSYIKILTEGNIHNQDGDITSSHWSKFSSKIGKVINTGRILARGAITVEAKQVQNDGLIHTEDILKTNKDFFNQEYGSIEAKSLSCPLPIVSRNMGKIELQDDIKLISSSTILKGILNTQGKFKVGGEDFTIEGQVSAQNGVVFDNLKKLTNKGTLSAFGAGLQGKLSTLYNDGKIDCSMTNAWIGRSTNHKHGIIRTWGHHLLQGDHYRNEGKIFTCGVHQAALTGSYEDTGLFYSPTLFLLNARDITYFPHHKSYFKDAVMKGTSKITAGAQVSFVLQGNQNPCFLHLISQGDLNYNGEIRQFASNRFPLLDFFALFNQVPVPYPDFAKEVAALPLGPWKEMKKSLGSGITIQAAQNLNCQKASIDPESGSLNLIANGQFYTEGARLKAGYFKGNNAAIQGRATFLNDTKLSSLFGIASVLAQDTATFTNSSVQGGQAASIQAYDSISMNSSTLTSLYGSASAHGQKTVNLSHSTVQGYSSAFVNSTDVSLQSSQVQSHRGSASVHGHKTANITNSSVQGHTSAFVNGTDVSFHSSQLESHDGLAHVKATQSTNVDQSRITGNQTLLEGGNQLTLSLSSLEGAYNQLMAEHINASSSTVKGATAMDGKKLLSIHNMQADGSLFATSPHLTFSGTNQATSLNAEGVHLCNTGALNISDSLRLKGETIEQLGTTKAGKNAEIEATHQYIDNAASSNEAGNILSLIAENTQGFKGRQKADTLIVKLEDMKLLDLLNQTDARITEAHLKEGEVSFDEDFTLNRTLHLWAKRLENKKKFTATKDFIAHIQTTIMNQGSMGIHGKGFLEGKQGLFTKDIRAGQGLGLKTNALLTLKGTADGGQGALSIDAGRIDADADGVSVSTFVGTGVYVTSQSDILARGGRVISQGDAQILGQGDINFDAVAHNAGNRTRYLSALYQVRGNLGIQTSGQFIGRALQASIGGDSFLKANRGVNIDSLASVYEAERWSYRTGWFDQNRHYGFREEAEFFRTNWRSQGRTYIHSSEAGISARGAAFFGDDEIMLDAFGKVDLGAVKATVRHYSYDESGVWRGFLGSIDERSGMTERAQTLQAISNRKIGIFSKTSTIESDAPYFRAPELELDAEQGIFFKPLTIHTEEKHHHSYSKLTFSSTSLGFEYGQQDTHATLDQEHAGGLHVKHMKIKTGKDAEAHFTTHITGVNPGEKTDFTTDTAKLIFSGVKNTLQTTSDSLKIKASIDVDLIPGGGFDISHSEGKKTTYAATVQNFGVFHNKRKGTKLIVHGGAQTAIEETKGEAIKALVDYNAQNEESQSGYAFGAHLSSTEMGAHTSIKGEGKVEADQLTGLKIGKATNTVMQTTINHDERVQDNRWGIEAGFHASEKGASTSFHIQYADKTYGATLPLDKKAFEFDNLLNFNSLPDKLDLESLNKLTEQVGSLNHTLNNLGINTGDAGNVINTAQQGTQLANQAADFFDKAQSFKTSDIFLPIPTDVESLNKLTGQLSSLNHTLNQLGMNTGSIGDVINMVQQGTQLASQLPNYLDQAQTFAEVAGSLPTPTNLDSLKKLTEQVSFLNSTLAHLGISTERIGNITNMVYHGMQAMTHGVHILEQAQSFKPSSLSVPIPTDLQTLNNLTQQVPFVNNVLNPFLSTEKGDEAFNISLTGSQNAPRCETNFNFSDSCCLKKHAHAICDALFIKHLTLA